MENGPIKWGCEWLLTGTNPEGIIGQFQASFSSASFTIMVRLHSFRQSNFQSWWETVLMEQAVMTLPVQQ